MDPLDYPVSSNIPIVLITGFGPFSGLARNVDNPSWEVAKALKHYLEWDIPVHIKLHQLQVVYDEVLQKVPQYWLQYNPTLVIHLGLAPGSAEIRIEKFAHNYDYCHVDNNGNLPESQCCVKGEVPEKLCCELPYLDSLPAIVKNKLNMACCVSEDAGRYLCEFIYYQSLFVDRKRCVFIHVPNLDNNQFTVEKLAEAIQQIIYHLLKYVTPLPIVNENGIYVKAMPEKRAAAQT